jgi:hypothetical protein
MSLIPVAPFVVSKKNKPCAEIAWLSCQSGSGPPFGGITRIRFKGSAPEQFGALSATRLPRTFFLAQNKTDTSEVNDEQIAGRL